MTRFDEPSRRRPAATAASRSGTRRGLVASRPLVALTMALLTAVAIAASGVLVGAYVVVPAALSRAFVAHPIVVYAPPTAARSETEALGDRLKALPLVDHALLRPREDALLALIQAGLPAAGDGRNPLPDAWILALRPEVGPHGSFVTTATSLRDTLAAMPGVDQVRFDARWNERLERGSELWLRRGRPIVAAGLCLIGIGLAGLWFVARDAITGARSGDTIEGERTLTAYVSLISLVGGIIAASALWSVTFGLGAEDGLLAVGGGSSGTVFGAILGALTLIAALIGWIASRRPRANSF